MNPGDEEKLRDLRKFLLENVPKSRIHDPHRPITPPRPQRRLAKRQAQQATAQPATADLDSDEEKLRDLRKFLLENVPKSRIHDRHRPVTPPRVLASMQTQSSSVDLDSDEEEEAWDSLLQVLERKRRDRLYYWKKQNPGKETPASFTEPIDLSKYTLEQALSAHRDLQEKKAHKRAHLWKKRNPGKEYPERLQRARKPRLTSKRSGQTAGHKRTVMSSAFVEPDSESNNKEFSSLGVGSVEQDLPKLPELPPEIDYEALLSGHSPGLSASSQEGGVEPLPALELEDAPEEGAWGALRWLLERRRKQKAYRWKAKNPGKELPAEFTQQIDLTKYTPQDANDALEAAKKDRERKRRNVWMKKHPGQDYPGEPAGGQKDNDDPWAALRRLLLKRQKERVRDWMKRHPDKELPARHTEPIDLSKHTLEEAVEALRFEKEARERDRKRSQRRRQALGAQNSAISASSVAPPRVSKLNHKATSQQETTPPLVETEAAFSLPELELLPGIDAPATFTFEPEYAAPPPPQSTPRSRKRRDEEPSEYENMLYDLLGVSEEDAPGKKMRIEHLDYNEAMDEWIRNLPEGAFMQNDYGGVAPQAGEIQFTQAKRPSTTETTKQKKIGPLDSGKSNPAFFDGVVPLPPEGIYVVPHIMETPDGLILVQKQSGELVTSVQRLRRVRESDGAAKSYTLENTEKGLWMQATYSRTKQDKSGNPMHVYVVTRPGESESMGTVTLTAMGADHVRADMELSPRALPEGEPTEFSEVMLLTTLQSLDLPEGASMDEIRIH